MPSFEDQPTPYKNPETTTVEHRLLETEGSITPVLISPHQMEYASSHLTMRRLHQCCCVLLLNLFLHLDMMGEARLPDSRIMRQTKSPPT